MPVLKGKEPEEAPGKGGVILRVMAEGEITEGSGPAEKEAPLSQPPYACYAARSYFVKAPGYLSL